MTKLGLGHTTAGRADAPLLVLGNSLGTTAAMWDAQMPALLSYFRVVRWDLPGHGRAPAPGGPLSIAGLADALIVILDELGAAEASYCGTSVGAMVGMSLAMRAPHRVRGLAVCCTSAHITAAQKYRDRAARVRRDGMQSIAATVISRWFTPDFRAREAPLVERMTEEFVATDAEGYARCCEAIALMDLRPELGLIRCPTLVISGVGDQAIPPEQGAEIAAAVAGSRFVRVERAAHLAPIERADIITPLLLDHLSHHEET